MKTIGFTLLLAVLTVSECSVQIVGIRGQNITLPCSYDSNYHGGLSVCWGRGDIPTSGCNRQIIAFDGQKVKKNNRLSSRYQLLGPLDQGDVSLTILNLTDEDAGRYGCRVEVAGWFNDEKHHIDLVIEEASVLTTFTPPDNEMTTGQTTVNTTTADQQTSSRNPMTSSSESVQAEESSSSESIVVMCVALGVVALVTAGVVVIAAKRWSTLKKSSQQQQGNTTVQFSATTSALQLRRHSSAVENIYQIDEGEYESCP